ncbi:MAG: FAD-dependent oxidoreductase [Deltaproteobacteria bacterium]|nr:FAD-dependent oxidoreductase [Deltaproteobacteria bacterium]
MRDYDAVVIGAGLGGLSAATYLAKRGKRVLLLERHNVPGGYASSFIRGRFEFEVALHELSGLGDQSNPGPLLRVLREIGVYDRVEFLPVPDLYRSYFPDFEIALPVGREAFEDALCRQFPNSVQEIKRFIATFFDFAEEALRANRLGMKAVMEDPGKFPALMADYGKSVGEVLNRDVPDPKAKAVLAQIWGYAGLPPSKWSFLIYALMMAAYIRFGPSHIRGTSQNLSQAFIDAFERYGGEVWLGNGARRILVAEGKVKGVTADDGTEIAAPCIVSNANPLTACLELIGPDKVPDWYLRRLGMWTPGASTFNVYLGLDCPYTALGLSSHENFVNNSYDLDGQYENARGTVDFTPDGIAMTAYNIVDRDVSPPGTTSMVLTNITYAEPWLKLTPADYAAAKRRLAGRIIDLAEKAAPGLRNHIEVAEVATPLTNIRYSGNPGGSYIGFDENFQGTGNMHLPSRGPIEGLYFSGAWVNIGGGFETCMESGFFAARDVLKDLEGGRDASFAEKMKSQLEKEAKDAGAAGVAPLRRDREVLEKIHADRLKLKVGQIIGETASAKTFRMESTGGPLPYFQAGQYINLFVNIDGIITSRPFSISSIPGESYYDITVRRQQGGFVSPYLLDRVKEGDLFESTGPNGNFRYEPLMDSRDLVLLAGGSGITPFISMLREMRDKRTDLKVHLIYGNRIPEDILFEKELIGMAAGGANFRVDFVISEPPAGWAGPCGFLDAAMIAKLIGPVEGKTFLVCGPAQMYLLCEDALKSLGVPARRIRKEVYGPPADVTAEPGWPGIAADSVFTVVEERSKRTIQARAGEPLMAALERAGLVVPALCRSGECSACRTRLLSGKVFAPARVRLRRADLKSGYIHPCMSYPVEDLRIRL